MQAVVVGLDREYSTCSVDKVMIPGGKKESWQLCLGCFYWRLRMTRECVMMDILTSDLKLKQTYQVL